MNIVTDLQSVADNIQLLADTLPELSELSSGIADAIADHTDDWTITLTPEQKGAVLKSLTGFVVSLGLDLACYPVGYTTAIFFDTDGNPVP